VRLFSTTFEGVGLLQSFSKTRRLATNPAQRCWYPIKFSLFCFKTEINRWKNINVFLFLIITNTIIKVMQLYLKYFSFIFFTQQCKDYKTFADSCGFKKKGAGGKHWCYANGHDTMIICLLRPIVSSHLTVIIEKIHLRTSYHAIFSVI
jgi:hypothetical protein